MGTKSVKNIVAILLAGAMLISMCSCSIYVNQNGISMSKSPTTYKTMKAMKKYLEDETGIKIVSVDDCHYEEKNKNVAIDIKLPLDYYPSLDDLDDIRVVLNDFMQEDGGFLAEGWVTCIYIDRVTQGSEKPTRFAVLSNVSYGYMRQSGWEDVEISDHLNTFFFAIDPAEVSYISELDDIEYIRICGKYTEYDTKLMETTISELSELKDLKSVTVYSCWYQAFTESGLGCEIIEMEDNNNGDL